jgi:uncharacterized protein
MIRVNVHSIQVSLLTQQRVIVLREVDSNRYLPIWIGPFEAEAIALALQHHEPPRPLTHDLMRTIITTLGGTVEAIHITDMQDSTFYARIFVRQQHQQLEIDARPSDAIALAVRLDTPIFVAEHILERVGQFFEDNESAQTDPPPSPPSDTPAPPPPENTADPIEDDLSLFRNFINTLDKKNDTDQQ